jgi:cytochrome P450
LIKYGTIFFRGDGFAPFKMMREQRADIYSESVGVLMEDGENWHNVRSKVQQDLMRPKSALFYADEIQNVADDFVDFIRATRTQEDKLIENFLPEAYRYAFESICYIALDARIGCLNVNMDPKIDQVFKATKTFLDSFPALFTGLPTWKFLPPRWNSSYREAQDALDIILNFGQEQVNEAIKRIDSKENDSSESDAHEISVLEKMIIRNGPQSTFPVVMALDLIFAGIDTTGNTLGMLLYHLATNPDKQEILRKECQSLGSTLNTKDLDKLKYLKACLRECFRLTPTFALFARGMPERFTLHGYDIPKDTFVLWSAKILSEDTKNFPDHDKFRPERWLDKNTHINPYSVRQFSKGPRMCIGKRFAELELLIATHKLMINFDVKWMNKDPLTVSQVLVNVPDQSLDFQFNDLK